MRRFQELLVWQRAHALVVEFYQVDSFDESPRYRDTVRQARRCAASISANIAEGAGSTSQASFANYLGIALASAHELDSHLLLARDIGCVNRARIAHFASETEQLKRMLTVLQRRIRLPIRSPRKQNGTPSK